MRNTKEPRTLARILLVITIIAIIVYIAFLVKSCNDYAAEMVNETQSQKTNYNTDVEFKEVVFLSTTLEQAVHRQAEQKESPEEENIQEEVFNEKTQYEESTDSEEFVETEEAEEHSSTEVEEIPIEELETEIWYATTDLNVRSGPGTEYDIIGGFRFRDEIKVCRQILDTGWVQVIVETDNQLQLGYSNKKYMTQNMEELNIVSSGPLPGYTDDDIYFIAQVITCEAGTEYQGKTEWVYEEGVLIEVPLHKSEMARVALVVINRVNSENFPNTLNKVVSASGQYPLTWSKIRSGKKPTEDAMEVARNILSGKWVPYFGDGQDKTYCTVYQGAGAGCGKGRTYMSPLHEYRYE